MNPNLSNLPTFTVTERTASGPVETTFRSAFATLAEAYHSLAGAVAAGAYKWNDFVDGLLLAARERRLSPKQIAWLHKLATEQHQRLQPRQDEAAPADGLAFDGVCRLLRGARASGRQWPKLRFSIVEVKLTRKGAVIAKTAGDQIIARTTEDGSLLRWFSPEAGSPEVRDLLARLAANPAAVAAQHGVSTGRCAFCGLALTTPESRSVGYGPVCAEKWGLPWGDTGVADAADEAARKV